MFLAWGLPEPNRLSISLVTCHRFFSCKLLQFPYQPPASTISSQRFHQSFTVCIEIPPFFCYSSHLVIILSFLHHSNIGTFVTNMTTIIYQSHHSHAEKPSSILLIVVQTPFIWSLLLALSFTILGNRPSSALFVTPSLTFFFTSFANTFKSKVQVQISAESNWHPP